MGYGRDLAVCKCRLTPRSLKFLECLEMARMDRPFIELVRSSPEGKSYGGVTPATVTSVTSHVRSSSTHPDCYLANGSPKDRREATNFCICQCSRVTVEGLLRRHVEETEIHRFIPGLPHALRDCTVPVLYPHHELPFQRVFGRVSTTSPPSQGNTNGRLRFSSCVGQFVLTASLRSQVNPENRGTFKDVSPERCVHL